MNIFNKENAKYVKLVLVVACSYLIIKLLDNTGNILSIFGDFYNIVYPFILAFVIAYILNPLVKFFNKKCNLTKGISIALTYILFIGLIALGSFYIFPKLYINIVDLIDSLPSISADVQAKANEFMIFFEKKTHISQEMLLNINLGSFSSKFTTIFTSLFSSIFNNLLNSAISITTSVVNIVFGFLISIYVLSDKELFSKFGKKVTLTILGKKAGEYFLEFLSILNKMVGTYIGIKAIDSLIIGVLAFIGLALMGSHYTLLLSVIVGITNMIPYFGPFIGMAVAFLVNLFSAKLSLAIICLIFLFLLQQFDAWYLDPHLIGNKVGLNAFLVILAVTIGGALYGPVGMILATPIASVIKIYTNRLLDKFEYRREGKKKKDKVDIQEEISQEGIQDK